jgi:hypothetical protein
MSLGHSESVSLSKPVFVPFALSLDQAEHAWGAVKAVLDSCRAVGRPPTEYAPLAAALVVMGRAIEEARPGA